MPAETDFEQTKNDMNPPQYGLSSSLSDYRIPPILQLHIKRAWITGLAVDVVTLAEEITKIDPRVNKNEVLRFLSAHVTSEEWTLAREQALNKAYGAMLQDAEKIREHIDQRYDNHFQKIQLLCAEQLDRFAAASKASTDPLSNKAISSIKGITNILKDTYLMQRLARGMSQGKYTHEVIQENAQFDEALRLLQERLEEKIIETQVKILPNV